MEDLLGLSVLFEYYGSMLTERQYDICDMYFNQNLSLGEISENLGITRQGVRDSLLKSQRMLVHLENNLNIMKKNEQLSEIITNIIELTDNSSANDDDKQKIIGLANQINDLI